MLPYRYGKDITDHAIFAETSQYWESEYHKDMNNLGKITFLGVTFFNLIYFSSIDDIL